MTVSQSGRQMIEDFEGLRLAAYQDGGGIWTLGFGHTAGVQKGDTCTREQADNWLAYDLETRAEHPVSHLVKVPLTQNQFDALCSLCFNIGAGNFANSTVLRRLNQGDYVGAAEAIPMWNRVAGEISPGLYRRRLAEKALFEV